MPLKVFKILQGRYNRVQCFHACNCLCRVQSEPIHIKAWINTVFPSCQPFDQLQKILKLRRHPYQTWVRLLPLLPFFRQWNFDRFQDLMTSAQDKCYLRNMLKQKHNTSHQLLFNDRHHLIKITWSARQRIAYCWRWSLGKDFSNVSQSS